MRNTTAHLFESMAIEMFVENGSPYFVLAHVCEAAGTDWTTVAKRLSDDEYRFAHMESSEGLRPVAVANLPGVYAVVGMSKQSAVAKRFKRWITLALLPSILSPGAAALLTEQFRDGLHSTTEIARSLGISPNALGRQTKQIKKPWFGEWQPAIALNSTKIVSQWWWNAAGRSAVLSMFGRRNA